MPAANSNKKGKKSLPKAGGQNIPPKLSVPSLIPRAAAAVPTTTSAFSSPEPDGGSTAFAASSRRLRASPSSSTINSIDAGSGAHLNVSSSLSHLLGPEGSPASRKNRPSSITSLGSPAAHLLSASLGSTATASPAATFLSISPPSPRKHTHEVGIDPDTSLGSMSHQDRGIVDDESSSPTHLSPKAQPLIASPLKAGAIGALKSLQRVASRDKLQQEQAEKMEQKKSKKQPRDKQSSSKGSGQAAGLQANNKTGSVDVSTATSEAESGSLSASKRHRVDLSGPQESAKHQLSAHAEADRLIESDRIEAEHLEAHVIKHQGDQLPSAPADTDNTAQSEQLSAAFMPQYQVRQSRQHRETGHDEGREQKPTADLVSTAHDEPESTAMRKDEPDPTAARRTKQSWHAQLEADRARVGAAVGDMVISRGKSDQEGARNQGIAAWRQWRMDDRSAEIGSTVSAGAARTPQIGLVWHGPGLSLPGRISDLSAAVKSRILGQGGSSSEADEGQHRSQLGVMHLADGRMPFGLPLPHSFVEWTTAALGAGVGMQVLTWALGGSGRRDP